jgi:predicted dehydrogenase
MTLHIGFIGAGRMAHLHASFVHAEPDITIAAACDHGSGRAADFTRLYGARAYSSVEKMLDEQKLDAVYICTPTATHATLGLLCAERGIHLFVEKPLDLDLVAASRLRAAVEAQRLHAMTCFQWRYSPGYRRARDLIGEEPVALVALRWYWTRPPIRWMWARDAAGGQIVDQNIHLLDASQGLAGPVATVYAAYNERQVNHEPEFVNWDGYALTLRYEQGAVGTCSGTYGLFPQIQDRPTADFALRDRLIRLTDVDVTQMTPEGTRSWLNNEPLHRGVNHAFLQALRHDDGAWIETPLATGIHSTALTLAATQSAQTGRPVVLADFLAETTGVQEGP